MKQHSHSNTKHHQTHTSITDRHCNLHHTRQQQTDISTSTQMRPKKQHTHSPQHTNTHHSQSLSTITGRNTQCNMQQTQTETAKTQLTLASASQHTSCPSFSVQQR
eukprot:1909328-Rhodomonas_salina.1